MTIIDVLFGVFAAPFLGRALLVLCALSVAAGIIGVLTSLRGLEFMSDGLSHAVFPGLAIGLAVGGMAGVLPGAVIAALVAAVVLTVLNLSRTPSDSSIAIVLTATFSIGVIVVSRGGGALQLGHLEGLLFGRILTIPPSDVAPLIVVTTAATAAILITLKQQIFRAADPLGSRAIGFSALRTDLTLTVAIALVVVAAAATIGSLLVLAFLLVPGAAARLITSRLWLLFPTAVGFALLASWLGLAAGAEASMNGWDIPAGATVALVFVSGYLLTVLGSVLARCRRTGRA